MNAHEQTSAVRVLAREMFGDVAELLGDEVLPSVCAERVRRVFENAKVRTGELGIEGGSVPARILYPIIRSAAVAEDDVVSAYLGGILCSARTPNNRDDRAVATLKMIDGLSSYALRVHCIVYSSLLRQSEFKLENVGSCLTKGYGLTLLLDEMELRNQMQFTPEEDADAILAHAFVNLSANDLCMQGIRPVMIHGESVRSRYMHPTLRGVELFCWGTGVGQLGVDGFFSSKTAKADVERFGLAPRALKQGHVRWD